MTSGIHLRTPGRLVRTVPKTMNWGILLPGKQCKTNGPPMTKFFALDTPLTIEQVNHLGIYCTIPTSNGFRIMPDRVKTHIAEHASHRQNQ